MLVPRALAIVLVLALVVPSVLNPATDDEIASASILLEGAPAERGERAGRTGNFIRNDSERDRGDRTPGKRNLRLQDRDLAPDPACDARGLVLLPESGLCTHGPDPAPPGLDADLPVSPVSQNASRRAVASLECDGDGQSDPRVQILYARASNQLDRSALFLASIRSWAGDADTILRESAAAAGGDRRFRFVTGSACLPEIDNVVLSPAADDSFDATIAELREQGYNRTDRIYLVFFDTTVAGICGVGTQWLDDDPSQANRNNVGPSYARVDAGCWRGDAVAHELMHTLGGVQDSAPHASLGGHCVDDYDLMCYSDPPNYPAVTIACPDRSGEQRFDCGYDDYFDPTAPAGSYLATHWNTANSQFLVGGGSGYGARSTADAAQASANVRDNKAADGEKKGKKGSGSRKDGKKGDDKKSGKQSNGKGGKRSDGTGKDDDGKARKRVGDDRGNQRGERQDDRSRVRRERGT